LNPVLNYEYSRKSVQNSDYCEYNVNGRIYNAKFCKNGKIALTSGTKGEVLDFSKVMEKFSENWRQSVDNFFFLCYIIYRHARSG